MALKGAKLVKLPSGATSDNADSRVEALVAFGSNLPSGGMTPAASVARAIAVLGERFELKVFPSRLYSTPAYPPGSGPAFVNAAAKLRWSGSARELLLFLHDIETRMGRTRNARWEARIMDLDLIALGQTVLPDRATQQHWVDLPAEEASRLIPDTLILPHPRLAERSFVLVPLAEIAPHWRHPVTGLSVVEMLAARPEAERAKIVPIAPDDLEGESVLPLPFASPGHS
jgi:2-amino-4-hydroxy-6-hydroxymethyldihydropteridine diphosphokinase